MIRQAIRKEMKARGENPSSLATEIGSERGPLYNFFKGNAGLSYKNLIKICIHYDLVLIKRFD